MKKLKQLLMKIFLPWPYYKELCREELTNAIHPEMGWIWRDDEAGGKAIAGARAEAFNRGWSDGTQYIAEIIIPQCNEANVREPYTPIRLAVRKHIETAYKAGYDTGTKDTWERR